MQKLLTAAGIIFFLFVGCLALTTGGGGRTASQAVSYEDDLTERCKDWLYWREQILKRHHAGDVAGADEARRNMNVFMRGLEARFDNERISNEISRLEDDAAKKGIAAWSGGAGK